MARMRWARSRCDICDCKKRGKTGGDMRWLDRTGFWNNERSCITPYCILF